MWASGSGGGGAVGFDSKFSVYRQTTQTIGQAAWTKVQWHGIEYDGLDEFDAVTNFRFVATVGGYYDIKAFVTAKNMAAADVIAARFTKNGSFSRYSGTPNRANKCNDGNSTPVQICHTIELDATDYVEVEAYTNSAGGIGIGDEAMVFTGERIA